MSLAFTLTLLIHINEAMTEVGCLTVWQCLSTQYTTGSKLAHAILLLFAVLELNTTFLETEHPHPLKLRKIEMCRSTSKKMLISYCSFPPDPEPKQGWGNKSSEWGLNTEHLANNNQRAQGRDNEAELEIPQTHGASSVIEPVLETRVDIL